MRRAAAPLWLAAPSRWAGLPPHRARLLLMLMAALVAGAMVLAVAVGGVGTVTGSTAIADAVVDGMRHGGDYYPVAATAWRDQGQSVPDGLSIGLPALPLVAAVVPGWAMVALLWFTGVGVFVAWQRHVARAFADRGAVTLALVLLAVGLAMVMRPSVADLPSVWSAMLVALSLGLRRADRWIDAAALGLAAMMIHPGAAAYATIMAVAALAGGHRREAAGWAAAVAVFAVVAALHWQAAAAVAGPVAAAMADPTAWSPVIAMPGPAWLAAPVAVMALIGWASWRDPLASRTAATLAAVLAMAAWPIPGGDVMPTWPLLPLGLVFLIDGWRDLLAAASDRRRITVRRVVR